MTVDGSPETDWHEIADDTAGLLLRKIVVGPLHTNCYAVTALDTRQTFLVDPGAEAATVLDAVRDLDVRMIVLTHSHFDHVDAVAEVADARGLPVAAHPADAPVWPRELEHLRTHGHFDAGRATADLLASGCSLCPAPNRPLWDGRVDLLLRDHGTLALDGLICRIVHTPGHTPGGVCIGVGGHLLTGDTVFPGGPGLTGWPLSDFPTIIASIRERLFTLPESTFLHPGHGPSTTIGAEKPCLDDWAARGW
jgi:glyoxylase-like metal-dependent hydrolase (beta-lactamase superfamily II)